MELILELRIPGVLIMNIKNLIIIALCLLMIGMQCSLDMPVGKSDGIQSVMIDLNKIKQVSIDGIDFNFKDCAFIDKNGKPVDGIIKLEIQHFNTRAVEILLYGAPHKYFSTLRPYPLLNLIKIS